MPPPRKAFHRPFAAPADAPAGATSDVHDARGERPSKSQVKRDMHALLALGKDLVALPDEKLKRLPLSESLYEAIRLAQRISSREGKRRQIHYVGKLMRQAPAQDIQAQLLAFKHGVRSAPKPSSPSHAHRASEPLANTQAPSTAPLSNPGS